LQNLESKAKGSFRASEARPGIQDFQAVLDSGFRRDDGLNEIGKVLKGVKKCPQKMLGAKLKKSRGLKF
jgi:hypothetical protein